MTNREQILKENEKLVEGFKKKYGYEKHMNPPIPDKFIHLGGEWSNGYIIESLRTAQQFVWIPVGLLEANGTLNGFDFNQQFGRRNYRGDDFSTDGFFEPLDKTLRKQIESIRKYGGFYVSRYIVSRDERNAYRGSCYTVRRVQKNVEPLVNKDWNQAKAISELIEVGLDVSSHLLYGAEYDSALEWVIESGVKSKKEVVQDSSKWGNYWNSVCKTRDLEKNIKKEWYTNGMYELAGNTQEWTQEHFGNYSIQRAIRGGSYRQFGSDNPAAARESKNKENFSHTIGFRVALLLR